MAVWTITRKPVSYCRMNALLHRVEKGKGKVELNVQKGYQERGNCSGGACMGSTCEMFYNLQTQQWQSSCARYVLHAA